MILFGGKWVNCNICVWRLNTLSICFPALCLRSCAFVFFAYFALRVLVSCPYLLSRTHLPGVTRTAAPLLSHTNTLEHTRGVLFRWKADLQLCQKTDETSEWEASAPQQDTRRVHTCCWRTRCVYVCVCVLVFLCVSFVIPQIHNLTVTVEQSGVWVSVCVSCSLSFNNIFFHSLFFLFSSTGNSLQPPHLQQK